MAAQTTYKVMVEPFGAWLPALGLVYATKPTPRKLIATARTRVLKPASVITFWAAWTPMSRTFGTVTGTGPRERTMVIVSPLAPPPDLGSWLITESVGTVSELAVCSAIVKPALVRAASAGPAGLPS